MRVLVTGGTGFIGSYVVEELVRLGYDIVVVANGRPLSGFFNDFKNKIQFFQADFGDNDFLHKSLPGCDAVIHLAWSSVPKPTHGTTGHEFVSNIISGINLIEKCIEHSVKKFIFISSGGTVYGVPTQIPIPESHMLNPISNYGLGKLTMEKILYLYKHSQGIDYTILRVSNAYGERQNLLKSQGVIGIWIKSILQKNEVEIWGDGSAVRDYVYVKDVASAIVSALHYSGSESIYNIGGGKGFSLNDILAEVRTALGLPFRIVYKQSRNFDVPINVLDISSAKKNLGYNPVITLAEGIRRTKNYIISNQF